MRGDSQPRGAALLEVIVALAILATAGVSAVHLVSESAHAVGATRASEEEIRRASAFLDAVSLWSRTDLDRRLGSRPQGGWRLYIERSGTLLYRVTLTDTATDRVLLATTLFRDPPESTGTDEP